MEIGEFREHLETIGSGIAGFGGFRLETHGPLAYWLATLGYNNVIVRRDMILFKVREIDDELMALDMAEWMPMWIAFEQTYLFESRVYRGIEVIETLDKMPK